MSEKLQDNLVMVDIMDTLVEVSVETKDDIQNEIDIKLLNSTNECLDSGSKSSRELKSILALSKEANLDTNIVHKRNSTDLSCKVEKVESGGKSITTTEEDMQTQAKPIIRVDYNKLDLDTSDNYETNEELDDITCASFQEDDHVKEAVLFSNNISLDINHGLSTNFVLVINNKHKDPFCWRCHHEKPTFHCDLCPRSYHQKCLKNSVMHSEQWICPVCVDITKAKSLKQRSPAMKDMSQEQFCGLLKFALKRMMQVDGLEPFMNPVNEAEFPEYKKYVAQPQDLTSLEKNIKNNMYCSPQAFEADAQWILHNSIIFNSNQSKFTSIAKSMMKICKHEMSEIENCASCYLNANTKKKTWFVEVCPKPHMVVWAKLKSFPYWPAKAMRTNSMGMVDVRFFGAHDRAWVRSKDCFLYCLIDPNTNKQKRNDINESIKELNIYIENLKRIYGEFCYAPYRTVLDPGVELKQLRIMLPKYDPDQKFKTGRVFRKSLNRNGNASPDLELEEKFCDISLVKQDQDSLVEDPETTFQSDGSNCGSTSDDSSGISNLSGRGFNVRKLVRSINSSGRKKSFSKITPAIKRQSTDNSDDLPPKLCRHDSHETLSYSDLEEEATNSKRDKDEDTIIEKSECPTLTEEKITSVITTTSNAIETNPIESNILVTTDENKSTDIEITNDTISPHESSLSDELNKKLEDLFEETPLKGGIVETDSLLDTINDKIDSMVNKSVELPFEVESVTKNITTLQRYSTNNETVGAVEVIEVQITESPEPGEPMELELSGNIEDIVQVTDRSTVSIATSEPDVETAFNSIDQSTITDCDLPSVTSNIDSLESNLTVCSNIDKYINPIDLVEVTENIPIEEKKDTEENSPVSEKFQDITEEIIQTIGCDNHDEADSNLLKNGKRRRSSSNSLEDATIDNNMQQKKSLRLVNIDDIRNKILDNSVSLSTVSKYVHTSSSDNKSGSCTQPYKSLQSLLEQHLLTTSKDNEDVDSIVIKSEPNSEEEEQNNPEVRERKLRYLYALNISEKLPQPPKKPVSMRTRSKSEENKIRLFNNASRLTEEFITPVTLNQSSEIVLKNTPPKKKEIFIKPLSKMQVPKQKARKSFPRPVRNVYPGHKKDVIRIGKPILPASTGSVRTPPSIKPNDIHTSLNNILYITHSPTVSNSASILPPNQPITYSANNRTNPVLTLMQHSNNYIPVGSRSNKGPLYESQNYIPLCGEVPKPKCSTYSRFNVNTHSENGIITTVSHITTTAISSSTTTPITSITAPATTNTVLGTSVTGEILEGLSSFTPDTLNKAIRDIMCRGPPKLKRRPPGPLSTHFDEGLPSSVGTVTSRVNSISHRLGDYFRGMLVELLHEMSTMENPEAEITKLKLENEELKHKHSEEVIEIKKNVNTMLKDVQKSIEEERTQIIEETRSACEAECLKRVEEAKSKQWCANCFKEAQFYCCWNTSYCDFPCQEKHWSKHMSKCTQKIENSRPSQSSNNSNSAVNTSTIRQTQPSVLRPTAPPQGFSAKALLAKPTKVIVNRSTAKNSISYVRTTSGSHITLVESTPGNFELVGNGGPISVGGKFITGLGKIRNNIIAVPPPPNVSSTSTSLPGNTQKNVVLTQVQPTVISDEEN